MQRAHYASNYAANLCTSQGPLTDFSGKMDDIFSIWASLVYFDQPMGAFHAASFSVTSRKNKKNCKIKEKDIKKGSTSMYMLLLNAG